MTIKDEFIPIKLEEVHDKAAQLKEEVYRFVQTHAVYNEPNVDLFYTWMKDGVLYNYKVEGVSHDTPVQSITDLFLAAFVFENEYRELFDVNVQDIAIDFGGKFYDLSEEAPMCYISPAMKAEKDKQKKIAAAKAAMAAKAKEGREEEPKKSAPADSEEEA